VKTIHCSRRIRERAEFVRFVSGWIAMVGTRQVGAPPMICRANRRAIARHDEGLLNSGCRRRSAGALRRGSHDNQGGRLNLPGCTSRQSAQFRRTTR
jgi:hypothetical protein